jgi:hypothetical protein
MASPDSVLKRTLSLNHTVVESWEVVAGEVDRYAETHERMVIHALPWPESMTDVRPRGSDTPFRWVMTESLPTPWSVTRRSPESKTVTLALIARLVVATFPVVGTCSFGGSRRGR